MVLATMGLNENVTEVVLTILAMTLQRDAVTLLEAIQAAKSSNNDIGLALEILQVECRTCFTFTNSSEVY